jgi:peptidoglycan/xylan/chitin deacetylase (PgdA/CDA1 family)
VEKYQRQAGLAVSGVLGPQTARRLAGTTWEVQVSRGDTLEAIAARYRLSLPEILDANPRIVNPDRIYAGQSVVIPGTAGILRIAGVEPSPASVPASGGGLSPVPAQSSQGQDKPASGGETQTIPPGAAALLTFNDGPDPDVLPRVLEILRRNNCRAVFFFCGEQMEQHPDLVKTASAQGHSIQSHGWRHEPLGALPETRITAELDATSRLIAGLTGKSPAFFRPPEGVMNEAIQMSARRTGQQIVGWQNIGALPDGPATVGRLDRWLTQRTVIMLPGADPATAGYLQALLDRWMAAGVQMLKPEDLGLMPVVW